MIPLPWCFVRSILVDSINWFLVTIVDDYWLLLSIIIGCCWSFFDILRICLWLCCLLFLIVIGCHCWWLSYLTGILAIFDEAHLAPQAHQVNNRTTEWQMQLQSHHGFTAMAHWHWNFQRKDVGLAAWKRDQSDKKQRKFAKLLVESTRMDRYVLYQPIVL